jgi:CRISPR/Cas system-associated exonuclease Cas4 (RecB family)
MLYQIAVSRLFGLTPTTLVYHYLEDGTKVEFLGTEKELAAFEEETEQHIERITSGDYSPKPGKHCSFCDFASICEYRA